MKDSKSYEDMNYLPAGLAVRSIAFLYDWTVVFFPFVFIAILGIFHSEFRPSSEFLTTFGFFLLLLYFGFFTSSRFRATPGKIALGLIVGNENDFSKISLIKSFGSSMIIALFFLSGSIGKAYSDFGAKIVFFSVQLIIAFTFLSVLFTTEKTSLNDIVFKIRVLHSNYNKQSITIIIILMVLTILIITGGLLLLVKNTFISHPYSIFIMVVFYLLLLFFFRNLVEEKNKVSIIFLSSFPSIITLTLLAVDIMLITSK